MTTYRDLAPMRSSMLVSIAGGPNRHGLRRRNIVWEFGGPVAFDTGPLSIAAVMHFAETITVQHDLITGLEPGIVRAQHPAGQAGRRLTHRASRR